MSAGDNKVLQLPEESEITLKAFVIEDQGMCKACSTLIGAV